ncbi:L-aspartate oxidase [Candidatus Williamhamiltonella defendens]|uniref:L-aspartate oxidase n=1 Tax=Candidatus Williamhamiltonella defendens TaxID=138072 RepID=UPI00130E805C|nr:L-aspartate oxidase [Candidatus Hamiltonella defensa]
MKKLSEQMTDVLIIGSGAAGLSLALRLAPHCHITLLSKELLNEGATFYAQGGIAAVFDEADSISSHVQDTLISGSGLCDKEIVEFVASHASQCIQWLVYQGVLFDTEINSIGQERYHLAREGGHTHRRILHSADATGKEVENTLIKKVLNHPNICIRERHNAVDLITSGKMSNTENQRIVGAYVWNRNNKKVETFRSKIVVLATGGAAKVYQYTTNPEISSGDGIAMAWRVGCRVANLEFNQFHPTCLFHPKAPNFLLTEALRGEGAYLKRPDGSRLMPDFDARLELAPRDIVARAIDHEMKRLGVDCMYLDISHKSSEFIIQHFPMIYKKLLSLGINLTKEPIPVVPAAHYTCGGVMVNQQGRTDLEGLYAIGEVSYTGLHGANRIASNSLLECLVYGWSAAEDILAHLPQSHLSHVLPDWDESRVHNSDEQVVIQHNWHELRLFMWDYMGIVRTTKRLERALRRINTLKQEVNEYYAHFCISNHLLELRNLLQTAELMVRCAIMRKESRGLHYTLDYPNQLQKPQLSILSLCKG